MMMPFKLLFHLFSLVSKHTAVAIKNAINLLNFIIDNRLHDLITGIRAIHVTILHEHNDIKQLLPTKLILQY